MGANNPHLNNEFDTKYLIELRTWTDYLARPKHRKRDMRSGTRNVRGLYRTGSLKTVARELGNYKLDLVGVQEVRWEKGGTERAEGYDSTVC
jgi:hypothetical protein